jgi:hypothetical protein
MTKNKLKMLRDASKNSLVYRKTEEFPQKTSHLTLLEVTAISASNAGSGMDQEHMNPFDTIDSQFYTWEAQTVSKDTEESLAYRYRQTKDATLEDIFGSFERRLEMLEFETHKQIKDFVTENLVVLFPRKSTTFMVFRNKHNKRFVASVNVKFLGHVTCNVFSFNFGLTLHAKYGYLFIVLAKVKK